LIEGETVENTVREEKRDNVFTQNNENENEKEKKSEQ
jgi:hypothetical protein